MAGVTAAEVTGDRWSLLVLRGITFGNRRHFRVLQEQSEEAIASSILADRLRRLVGEVHVPSRPGQTATGRRAPAYAAALAADAGH